MYIVFEGIIGSGKSTQAELLAKWLRQQFPKRQVVFTREPGGTEISEAIRKLVQGTSFGEEMDPTCEAYLYAASRAQSLARVVKPCLASGGIVVADRSFVASMVYQGYARGLGPLNVYALNSVALKKAFPDLIILLNLDVKEALSRKHDHSDDKWGLKREDFFQKVQAGYCTVSALPVFMGSWITVDASGSVEEVSEKILCQAQPYLQRYLR